MAVTYRELALKKAISQIGVKEQPAGSNRGPKVDQYQEADSLTNPDHGYAWCASFVNWCFREVDRPLVELGRSASVAILLAAAKQHGWAHTETPEPGDLVCYDWDTLAGPGKIIGDEHADHIGIVRSVNADGSFTAVEGNTAVGNDSNGGEVMDRLRSRSMVEGFIRVPGGYAMVRRYRLLRGDEVLGEFRLARVLTKVARIVRSLGYGERVSVRRIAVKKARPDA